MTACSLVMTLCSVLNAYRSFRGKFCVCLMCSLRLPATRNPNKYWKMVDMRFTLWWIFTHLSCTFDTLQFSSDASSVFLRNIFTESRSTLCHNTEDNSLNFCHGWDPKFHVRCLRRDKKNRDVAIRISVPVKWRKKAVKYVISARISQKIFLPPGCAISVQYNCGVKVLYKALWSRTLSHSLFVNQFGRMRLN